MRKISLVSKHFSPKLLASPKAVTTSCSSRHPTRLNQKLKSTSKGCLPEAEKIKEEIVNVGRKLGLYEALADLGACTSVALAA